MTEPWRCSIIGSLVVALLGAAGCHGQEPPSAPSGITPPPAQTPPAPTPTPTPYTISGVVTAYHGGPIEGVEVSLGTDSTRTGADGRYSFAQASSNRFSLYLYSPSEAAIQYTPLARYDIPGGNQTVDFILHPLVMLSADSTISGTIHGDEIAADDEFGGRCTSTACTVVTLDCCVASVKSVELTLSWNDPSRQLVIYVPHYDYFPIPVPPATRACCGSPLTTTYTFNGDYDRIAIGFEGAGGGPPLSADSQAFKLTARSIK
jgi:hypothetical protein